MLMHFSLVCVCVCVCVLACVCVYICIYLIHCTRVASVQSEPGQQNLLIQPPLGRKRGLRQVRTSTPSFLLHIPKGTENTTGNIDMYKYRTFLFESGVSYVFPADAAPPAVHSKNRTTWSIRSSTLDNPQEHPAQEQTTG